MLTLQDAFRRVEDEIAAHGGQPPQAIQVSEVEGRALVDQAAKHSNFAMCDGEMRQHASLDGLKSSGSVMLFGVPFVWRDKAKLTN